MIISESKNWHLVLADLALVLFLTSLAGLAAMPDDQGGRAAEQEHIAAAQSLYRPDKNAPPLARWLDQQAEDARASLTIVALYDQDETGSQERAWQAAAQLGDQALAAGKPARIIIRPGGQFDIYASLAFDNPEIAAVR